MCVLTLFRKVGKSKGGMISRSAKSIGVSSQFDASSSALGELLSSAEVRNFKRGRKGTARSKKGGEEPEQDLYA